MNADEEALCHILVNASHQDRALIFATVDARDFLDPIAAAFVEAVRDVWDSHRQVDSGTLVDALTRSQKLAMFGDIEGLAAFISKAGISSENAEFYASRVRNAALLRRMRATARSVADSFDAGTANPNELIGNAIARFSACLRAEKKDYAIQDVLYSICRSIGEGGAQSKYTPTGFPVFDATFMGIPEGLVVVGARPGVGKTSFCLQVARYVGRTDPVLVVSLEMTREEVARVLIAQECGVQVATLPKGFATREAEDAIVGAAAELNKMPSFHVIEPVSCSVSAIRAIALHHKHAHGLRLLVVDYLQRVKGDPSTKYGSREQEVAHVSTGLSELAKELGCPVLAPCAINREMTRSARKPTASDLRESGNIESDAHMVIMIHRPDVTNADADASIGSSPSDGPQFIVAKHRGGPLGTIPFTFEGPSQKFVEEGGRFGR